MPSFSSLPRALLVRSDCLSAHSGLSVPSRTYLMDTSVMSSVPPRKHASLHLPSAASMGLVLVRKGCRNRRGPRAGDAELGCYPSWRITAGPASATEVARRSTPPTERAIWAQPAHIPLAL